MSNQTENNNLNYLIDSTFTNVKMKLIELLSQSIMYQVLK